VPEECVEVLIGRSTVLVADVGDSFGVSAAYGGGLDAGDVVRGVDVGDVAAADEADKAWSSVQNRITKLKRRCTAVTPSLKMKVS